MIGQMVACLKFYGIFGFVIYVFFWYEVWRPYTIEVIDDILGCIIYSLSPNFKNEFSAF